MLFFIRSIFPQTILNAYIVFRIWKNQDIPKLLKGLLSLIYILETGLYFTGLFGGENLSIETYTLIQKISGVWVVGNAYLLCLIFFLDLIQYLSRKISFLNRIPKSILKGSITIFFCLFTVFIGLELYWGYDNFMHPKIKTFPFSFNKTENSPEKPLSTYKMLVASDIHLGYIVDCEKLKVYVDLINAQQADIVVIDGDLVDYTLRPLIEGKMDEELQRIKAPKGVYFIPGNHEYKFNPELKLDWIREAGMVVLKDSIITIDNQLTLIGRDDRSNEEERMKIEDLMAKVDTSKACIFLAHQPGDIKDAWKYNIPLTVCGHTHGGQAFPMNWGGHLLYSYTYGMYHKGDCYSYVTSGLGLSGFPLRIATDSEVVVFNISIY